MEVSPNCRFSSKTLSQANTYGLYETVNCISTESALLPRQINWLDLYICPTEFKQRERMSEWERNIISDALLERGSVLEKEFLDIRDTNRLCAALWFPGALARPWVSVASSWGTRWGPYLNPVGAQEGCTGWSSSCWQLWACRQHNFPSCTSPSGS